MRASGAHVKTSEPIQAEDILFVPSSAGKVALYRVLKHRSSRSWSVDCSSPPAIACKDQAAVLGCSLSRIPSNTAM